MKRDLMKEEFPTLAIGRINQKEYSASVKVLHFDSRKKNLRGRVYLRTIIELDYNPLNEGVRTNFTVVGWSDVAANKRILFSPRKETSSFPFCKRFFIRVPINPVAENQKICFRMETYQNVFSKKGQSVDFSYRLNLKDML